MKNVLYFYIITFLLLLSCNGNKQQKYDEWLLRTLDGDSVRTQNIDTMQLRNPFIFLDRENLVYYMTGDGGTVWTSKNMHTWVGPYNVLQPDPSISLQDIRQITAPEIHKYKNRYYYIATFAPNDSTDNTNRIFVSDSIQGPYKPVNNEKRALSSGMNATMCHDEHGYGYLIYNQSTEKHNNIQIILLTENFNEQIGEPYVMLSSESQIIDGPFIFETEEYRLGMLFTTQKDEKSMLCAAYSEKGEGLNGPWHIEQQPLLADGYGQAMLFNDYDGTLMMALHKDTTINGKKTSLPRIFEVDTQLEKLKIKKHYKF